MISHRAQKHPFDVYNLLLNTSFYPSSLFHTLNFRFLYIIILSSLKLWIHPNFYHLPLFKFFPFLDVDSIHVHFLLPLIIQLSFHHFFKEKLIFKAKVFLFYSLTSILFKIINFQLYLISKLLVLYPVIIHTNFYIQFNNN